MTQYEKIVVRTQDNYVRYHEVYAAGCQAQVLVTPKTNEN